MDESSESRQRRGEDCSAAVIPRSPDAPDFWRRVFVEGGHRFQMALRRGDAGAFWQNRDPSLRLERERWLRAEPERYLGVVPESAERVRAALVEFGCMTHLPGSELEELARLLEPDWLLLEREAAGWRVCAGAVVFPSSWALEEKLGLPLREVHAPVPGLNADLGERMELFLDRLSPAVAWERWNWGLSADAELNHHPALGLPGLLAGVALEDVWVRLEEQHFTGLPCGLALFGIRVSCHSLAALAADAVLAGRIAAQLETMGDAVAEYKGLNAARPALVRALRAAAGRS